MRFASGMLAALILFSITARGEQAGSQLSIRWIGQDGHDYVGPNNRLEPSDVQDVHLAVAGLDPEREIVFVDVTTGQGGDQWQYNAQSFAWKAEVKRAKGSRSADLFLEPGHVEAPRAFHVLIRYDNGETHEQDVRGRKVSRSLRVPGAALQAKWLGQDRHDRVGTGPAVGPDGIQDGRIQLTALSTRIPVQAIRIEASGGAKWESGANPQLLPSAEFWPDPKKHGEGQLHFQPDRDLKGQRLKVLVLYANETIDSATLVAGRCDPKLRTPESPLPKISELAVKARWLGQDGQDATGPGDVHVTLSGMTRVPAIAAAVLTDSVRGTWVLRRNDRMPYVPQGDAAAPLVLRPGRDRGSLELFFAPYRDESRATLTLRLIEPDGKMVVARFPGGPCDPGRRAARPAESSVNAKPGDDLGALASQYGTVTLAPGNYRLSHPLILSRPVTLRGDGKATIVFAQAPTDPPWTAAIKVHRGNTTLEAFAVRFEGPVRWDQQVSYGPAVIGTTDDHDQGANELKVNVALRRLDLEIPSAPDPSKWIDAVRLIRLTRAQSGQIAACVLRGGPIEFFEGPWQITENEFRGTQPGTVSHGVFTGHGTYDLLVKGNKARPVGPDGKTWRFLVLTHRGSGDRVEDNIIEGIGSREGDTIPWSNEPEIILTEAYHLSYEGRVAALGLDGRLLRVHALQGQEAETGDVVAILTGQAAGSYRRIVQVIDPTTFLLDSPVPKGTEAVSVCRGFVGETFERNRIDVRAGRLSAGMVLVGNHYGTRIAKNHILGGALAIKFTACPTETPVIWGWSHAPVLQAEVTENVFEDSADGAALGVEHAARDVKSSKGRTYMTLALHRNVVRWTPPFLSRLTAAASKPLPPGLSLGFLPSHDPGEFVVKATGNRLDAPAGTKPSASLLVHAAEYNSRKIVEGKFSLPSGAEPPRDRSGPRASRTNASRPLR
jgi:hypothetical protein